MEQNPNSTSISSNKSSSAKSLEVIPYRPELRNVTSEKITLLSPPPGTPYHPRTLFFFNDPEVNPNEQNKQLILNEITIQDKKFMIFYKAYKNLPLCLSEPMKYNNIIRSKLFDDTNIIWKLLKKDKMFPLLKEINKYQRFNHFPMTWQLSRKDNLYTNFKKMKNKHPNDYTYMPETYVLPRDTNLFQPLIENYKMSVENMWLIKPVASSRGRGIHLMTNSDTLPTKGLITRYIYNPHLINNKKYDLRLYLLVTGYAPLKIYLFDEGLTRFASEEYNLNQYNMTNRYIHLTNYSINKNSEKYQKNDFYEEEEGNKWSLSTLRNHFKNNKSDFGKVWEKIKDIMIKTILSVTDEAIPLIKSFNLSSGNLFELYGVDVLLDKKLNPWLMEVNLNPSLNCDSEIDLKIKSKLLTDIFNIIGVVPFSHDKKMSLLDEECKYKDKIEEAVMESLCEFERPTGSFQRIFPLKNNIDNYRKFLENPGEENEALWEKMKQK